MIAWIAWLVVVGFALAWSREVQRLRRAERIVRHLDAYSHVLEARIRTLSADKYRLEGLVVEAQRAGLLRNQRTNGPLEAA